MPQRTITVKGVAGLGNRIITLAWAIRKARQYNSRILVDWSDGQIAPKGLDLFSTYFASQLVHKSIISDWRIHSTSSEAKYNLLPSKRGLQILAKIGWINSTEIWKRKYGSGNRYILPLDLEMLVRSHGFCAAHLPSIECQKEIGNIFFNEDTCKKFDLIMPMDIGERIGIHIRHSDKKATVSFEDVLHRFRDKKIFLATDSEIVKQHALSLDIDLTCISTMLHDGKESGGVHHRALGYEEKIQTFEEGALDMYCLTKCQMFVGQSNSSFSRVVKIWRADKKSSIFWA